MISLAKYPSIKTKGEYACFIKFQKFSQEYVTKVKSLPCRYYEPHNKVWEVPINDIDRVVATFGVDNITIFNDFPEAVEYLENLKDTTCVKKKTAEELLEYYKNIKCEVDYEFKTKPDGHQIEAFNIGLHRNNLIITDVPGLGKTKSAIDIMDYKVKTGQVKHVLVICGVNGLKYNWEQEIKKHSWYNCQVVDGSKETRLKKLSSYWMFTYTIINIESIRNNEKTKRGTGKVIKENDNEILIELAKMCELGKFDAIIVDEFHKANNHKSQQGKGLRSLNAKYKIALSGTPITKKLERSWSILNWMGFEEASYWQFVKRYCTLGGFSGWDVVGYKNLDEFHERFDRAQLRRTKDILQLPPKTHQVYYVEMSKEQRKEYEQIKRGIIQEAEETKVVDPAVATLRLRQFTDKVKTKAVKEIVDQLADNNEPCIIFSCFKDGLYELQNTLTEYNPLLLTGDITNTEDKQKVVDDFQVNKKSNVIMGTIQAMGTGYTLTRSQYVVFLNKAWSPTDNEQAEDRAHRRGTTGNVTIISVVVKNSIDEKVEEILKNDKLYIDKVVDGIPLWRNNGDLFKYLMED